MPTRDCRECGHRYQSGRRRKPRAQRQLKGVSVDLSCIWTPSPSTATRRLLSWVRTVHYGVPSFTRRARAVAPSGQHLDYAQCGAPMISSVVCKLMRRRYPWRGLKVRGRTSASKAMPCLATFSLAHTARQWIVFRVHGLPQQLR